MEYHGGGCKSVQFHVTHILWESLMAVPPPLPSPRNSYTVRSKVSVVEWQRKNEASIHRIPQLDRKITVKPLCCLLLNCLPRTRTACSNDGHASYFAEAPCSRLLPGGTAIRDSHRIWVTWNWTDCSGLGTVAAVAALAAALLGRKLILIPCML